jgi:squalene-associated FAD-dependent desaturase
MAHSAPRFLLITNGTIHVIGAGLAGLSAAVRLALAGRRVVVHELARHAGGRCRSYFEPALGLTIDNGNHLLLSGNHAAIDFLKAIGGENRLVGPREAVFTFADLATGERWRLRPNNGLLPWWIFSETRRVPRTRALDYLSFSRLLFSGRGQTVGEVIDCGGLLYERLWRPVLLAALNAEPSEASAQLAGAVVRESLARGSEACRPLFAVDGLGPAFVDPAIARLRQQGAVLRFDHQLRRLDLAENRVRALDFGEDVIKLARDDIVILAVPAWVAPTLVPQLVAPKQFRAILNAHFAVAPPPGLPSMLGVINGTTEWLFSFADRLSVTISAADRFNDAPRESLARTIWSEVAALTGLNAEMPRWHIIKERRATFAALPGENAQRPGARTRWCNLILAGDWTATGLPSTIEGSIRSGNRAADMVTTAQFW